MTKSERILAGIEVLSGKPVKEVMERYKISQSYGYQLRDEATEFLSNLDTLSAKGERIELTPMLIKRTVVGLALYARAPESGIQAFFEYVFNKHISIGKISGILKEAAENAKKFDEGVDLSNIEQGANDEIFQRNKPVLTGIDLESTYTYSLEPFNDRRAETWQLLMETLKERGLKLKLTINDGAQSLISGIKSAFPDIDVQLDVFHVLRDVGIEVEKALKHVYSDINAEFQLEKHVATGKAKEEPRKKLDDLKAKFPTSIRQIDSLCILMSWLKILLGFSGYGLNATKELLMYTLSEMKAIAVESKRDKLLASIKSLEKNITPTLTYIDRLWKEMIKSGAALGIPPDMFELMYRQLSYAPSCPVHQEIERQLAMTLLYKYDIAREEFGRILQRTNKASSLVENLNGRIRTYMNLKRVVPDDFLILLKVFFNTRPYGRSRYDERKGKSPIELMTGKQYPDFLDIVCPE